MRLLQQLHAPDRTPDHAPRPHQQPPPPPSPPLTTITPTSITGHSTLPAIINTAISPTKAQALGMSLPHALATTTIGALTQPIAPALKHTGPETSPSDTSPDTSARPSPPP
jgi:hypothetical protein